MNTSLRYAQREVARLKRPIDKSDTVTFDLVLKFDRSEDEMRRLTGYPAFAKALEELGGEHTEDNIQRACDMTGFSRENVYFDDMDNGEDIEDYHIPVTCTRNQAKKTINSMRNRELSQYPMYSND